MRVGQVADKEVLSAVGWSLSKPVAMLDFPGVASANHGVKAVPEPTNAHMVNQSGELLLSLFLCCLSHTA
jgi:hypothetical protein